MAIFLFVLLWMMTLSAGTDISYLDRSLSEKDIAAVFNKVAYGGITTTKRSISSKYLPSPGMPTTVVPPLTSISISLSPRSATSPSPQFGKSFNDSRTYSPPRPIPRHNITIPNYMTPKTPNLPPFTTPNTQEVPSYVPPMRKFFTPPLPPEYSNPFADKPTLRGSYSDSGTSNVGRRPIPPPPRPPLGRERIPLRPPDLATNIEKENSPPTDRKKPLNTPSFNRSPETPYSEIDGSNQNTRQLNESDYEVVPILHSPSISRILSGSNGRKQSIPDIIPNLGIESKSPQLPGLPPKVESNDNDSWLIRKDITQTLPKQDGNQSGILKTDITDLKEKVSDISTGQVLPSSGSATDVDENKDKHSERLPDTQHSLPIPGDPSIHVAISPSTPAHKDLREKWGVAWDIHIYLTGSLFTILSLYSVINIARVNACKRLLSFGYYISLHGFLFVIGILRSVYLFYDAYNVSKLFPEPVALLLLHIVAPCITSAFLILFIFLLQSAKVNMISVHLQKSCVIIAFILLHLCLCICLDLTAGFMSDVAILPLICQCIFIVVCVCFGLAYVYMYRVLEKSATRKHEHVFGSAFTNLHRPSLAIAVRTTLATSLLCLLLAAVQLYGIFGVNETLDWETKPLPWLRWGHQFSVRIIELSICFLLLWAGIQSLQQDHTEEEKNSQSSGFALFRCRQCTTTPQNSETADDIYPAVCVTNQAIHDYTVRTGKKVYDDSFPLNNLHTGFPLQEPSFSISTSERRLLKKSAYSHDASYPAHEAVTSDRRLSKKASSLATERPEFDLPFSTTSEVRRSLKNSGTLIILNMERPEASFQSSGSSERRTLKASSALDSFPSIAGTSDIRRSLKKSGTLASLSSDRRTPVNQHKCGAQTLSSTRDRVSPSMLVAENGFVRFRTLADSEEQDMSEAMPR